MEEETSAQFENDSDEFESDGFEEENEDEEFEQSSDEEFAEEEDFEEEEEFDEEEEEIQESPTNETTIMDPYFEAPEKMRKTKNKTRYEVLHKDVLYKSIKKDIKKLKSTLFIDNKSALELLSFYDWNVEKIINIFFDKGKDYIFKKVGIDNLIITSKSKKEVDCPICFETVKEADTLKFSKCNHFFCKSCIKNHLSIQLKDHEKSIKHEIKCLAYKCDSFFNKKQIADVFSKSTDDKHRFLNQIFSNYAKGNKDITFCPGINCPYVVKKKSNESVKEIFVHCECGTKFCFNCKLKFNHFPATCKQMQKWLQNIDDDIASLKWIEQNSKACPKCNTVINKNGGCNHMCCSYCNTAFCWVCLTPFTNYIHNCVFKTNVDLSSNKKIEELDKTYYNSSLSKWNSIKTNMKKFDVDKSWFKQKWIREAIDILKKARKTMMNAIVFYHFTFNRYITQKKARKEKILKVINLKANKETNLYKKINKEKRNEIRLLRKELPIVEEEIKRIMQFKEIFLFYLEQLEHNIEKLAKLIDYPQDLPKKKKEVVGIATLIFRLFQNIKETIQKKDDYFISDLE